MTAILATVSIGAARELPYARDTMGSLSPVEMSPIRSELD